VSLEQVDILGVGIASAPAAEVLAQIERHVPSGGAQFIAFANANTLNLASQSAYYRAVLNRADLILNDGVGVALAARMKNRRFPENLNGTDFTPRLLALAAARGWNVYLLGGNEGTAAEAAAKLIQRIPGLRVVGTHHGYLTSESTSQVVARIRAARADVVVVAMGNPAQEYWLAANLDATGARIGIGVGAFLDFAAGRVARAPGWLRRARLEWAWRLVIEPRRLWRRYLVGNPLFLYRAMRYTRRMRYQGGPA
jgi:exopolysaccharide biosynthesis WecB/TagA/CpsF family protein